MLAFFDFLHHPFERLFETQDAFFFLAHLYERLFIKQAQRVRRVAGEFLVILAVEKAQLQRESFTVAVQALFDLDANVSLS